MSDLLAWSVSYSVREKDCDMLQVESGAGKCLHLIIVYQEKKKLKCACYNLNGSVTFACMCSDIWSMHEVIYTTFHG